MSIEVITISNRRPEEAYYTYDQFHASLSRFGFRATVLGQNSDWRGLMGKPRRLLEYLKSGKCAADVISINDSWDSVWQKSPADAENEFKEIGSSLIIGSEMACFPDASLGKRHSQCMSRFRYVNTGMIIGTREAVLSMLESLDLDSIPDDHQGEDGSVHINDQDIIMRAYLDMKFPALLDGGTRFVVNLCGVKYDDLDWSGRLIQVNETGNTPYVLHLNGGAKTDGLREHILKKLAL